MNVLAIDTATEACSAALSVDGRVLSRFERVGRGHTERLAPMVLGLLAEAGIAPAQLDAYVCGVGPGSFAGVRIGVGYVKGLALAVERPAVAVSSLDMLAHAALGQGADRVLAVIDARLDEVYVGAYGRQDGHLHALAPARVCAPQQASAPDGGSWWGVGSGWNRYAEVLRAASGDVDWARIDPEALPAAVDALAIGIARLGGGGEGVGESADALAPVYLRDKVALTLDEQQAARRRKAGGPAAD